MPKDGTAFKNLILTKIFDSCGNSLTRAGLDSDKQAQFRDALMGVLADQSGSLAIYLSEALVHAPLADQLIAFMKTVYEGDSTPPDNAEFVFEAVETACSIRTSVVGFISQQFTLNAMKVVQAVKGFQGKSAEAHAKTDKAFITFIMEVMMN